MMLKACTAAVALLIAAPATTAQDLDTSQLSQHADVVRHGILVDKTVRRGSGGGSSYAAKEARARATCANRQRAVENLGASHPTTRQLFALCERLGFD